MLTHHLFADSATLEMMNVQCMFPEEILLIISGAGKVCVAIFVFISAYGITMSNNENNNTTIVISRRIVKLLVPFMYIYHCCNSSYCNRIMGRNIWDCLAEYDLLLFA